MPLIVVGCMRSGTQTMARLIGGRHEDQYRATFHGYKKPLYSEASCFAVPFIRDFKKDKVSVLHIVRDPIKTIRSQFVQGHWNNILLKRWIFNHTETVSQYDGNRLKMAMAFYLEWNTMCADVPRIRIEDIRQVVALGVSTSKLVLGWNDLPDCDLAIELGSRALVYGYDAGVK